MNDPSALLKLFASGALGFVFQWAMFAPKKVPSWVAWAALVVASALLYWWATPTLLAEIQANWRFAIVGLVSFILAAKGTGSAAKAAGIAPGSNSL
jgi:hypothetical protein